jgi:hypothetical protein
MRSPPRSPIPGVPAPLPPIRGRRFTDLDGRPIRWRNTFERQTTKEWQRLVVAPASPCGAFRQLLDVVDAPGGFLLYVLIIPVEGAEVGRYESPELDKHLLHSFLARFGPFLETDGRHQVWAYLPDVDVQLVWTHHELIHAYGPLDAFDAALRRHGFREGEASVTFPHTHHYHSDLAQREVSEIMRFTSWCRKPLRPGDDEGV